MTNFLYKIMLWPIAILIAMKADPDQVLNRKEDPYAPWVIIIAKIKKALMFWRE